MSKRCFIVGAGSFDGFYHVRPSKGDYVIAADGGYAYLQKEGVTPDALLGDFDSLEIVPEHKNLIRHSPIKDDTDMALAVEYAISLGYDEFYIYGGLGGRMDHSLANIQVLTGLSRRNIPAYLLGEGIVLTAITNETLHFEETCEGMISVFCLGERAEHIYETGLKYTLNDAIMTCDRALGVSNEFIDACGEISVGEGSLLILWGAENPMPSRASFLVQE